MTIRTAAEYEIDDIMAIYVAARRYMADNGNPTQWGNTHPTRATADIVGFLRNVLIFAGRRAAT